MKAILSVIGKDKLGIIASVSKELSDLKINIEDSAVLYCFKVFVRLILAQ